MKYSHLGMILLTLIALAGCQVTVDGERVGSSSQGSGTPGESEDRSVSLYWSAPMERVNGESLANSEIAGYEIRYRKDGEAKYTRVVIDNATTTQHHIDNLESGDYRFEIAVFDTSGLYSEFVVAEH